MENCRRCWVKVDNKSDLWCPKCRERVDEEFDGQICRPFNYYFRWWNKKRKSIAILYSNLIKHG